MKTIINEIMPVLMKFSNGINDFYLNQINSSDDYS